MSKKTVVILPETQRILERMGDQIKTARLRRNLATELVAERAGISRATLWSVEKGSPTVAIEPMRQCFMRWAAWIKTWNWWRKMMNWAENCRI